MNTKLQQLFSLQWQEETLKKELNEVKEQINLLEQEIGKSTVFPQGKKTFNYEQDGFYVKVERKETLKWDQDKLNKTRAELGDETFLRLFKFEWKHKQKAELDKFLAHDAKAKSLQDALTISDKFSVSIKNITEATA